MSAEDEQGSMKWRMDSGQRSFACEHEIAAIRPSWRTIKGGFPSYDNSPRRWNKKPTPSQGFNGKRRYGHQCVSLGIGGRPRRWKAADLLGRNCQRA
jgi:hypothetical protein